MHWDAFRRASGVRHRLRRPLDHDPEHLVDHRIFRVEHGKLIHITNLAELLQPAMQARMNGC